MTPGIEIGWAARDVQFLKGAGPKRARLLEKLEIRTVEDLLLHRPAAYLDRRAIVGIASLKPGTDATVMATVERVDLRRPRGRGGNVVARIVDETGKCDAIWFGQPYLKNTIRPGSRLLLSGRVRTWKGVQLQNPEFELVSEDGEAALSAEGRIVPVYPLTAGISQKILRGLIRAALDTLPVDSVDLIPLSLRRSLSLPSITDALQSLHFPETLESAERARIRLAFEELLLLQLLLIRLRMSRGREDQARVIGPDRDVIERIVGSLPFKLTAAQDRAIEEISSDLAGDRPMRRLLQGDVGSGKTVVAAIACASAAASGSQACFLAPTEVLVLQHARTLTSLLEPVGIVVRTLIGRTPAAERREIRAGLEQGTIGLVVGTHALLEPDVRFDDLGLVVVDEQHRFGVYQRLKVREKGERPHTLVMSATPIPRTLALTLYGDLDVTTIDEIPPGRTPVQTRIVERSRWDEMLTFVAGRLREGEQAFFVYPLVAESEAMDLRDATAMRDEIAQHPAFDRLNVGLLHSRIEPAERERTLESLRGGEMHALVATTVIEVGLDLPKATVMIVEHPERFGLSQLHQLRGRIGRAPGETPYMFLILSEGTGGATERLKVLARESDGFRVAEEDLRLRGPGQLLGTQQTGLPRMRVADLSRDKALLLRAREAATELLEADPECKGADHRPLWLEVLRRYPDGARFFETG